MRFQLTLYDISSEWTKREIRDYIINALDRTSRDIPYVDFLGVYQNLLDARGNIIGRYAVKNDDGTEAGAV